MKCFLRKKAQFRVRDSSFSRGAIVLFFWIAWMLCLPRAFSASAAAEGEQIPPEVEIRLEAHPKIATVGDPIRIELDIVMPEGSTVEIPRPEAQTGDFAVLDFFPGPTVPDDGKAAEPPGDEPLRHHRARILAAVYKTGKFVFPSLPLKLKTKEGKEIPLAAPTAAIEIQSVLPEEDPQLKDLKKQAELPEPAYWPFWLAAAAVCAVLGWLLRRYWKKRSRSPQPLSPAEVRNALDLAEADLRELLARGLPDARGAKHFYVLLSEIVKRILEAAYEIPTAERTTLEIADSLHGMHLPQPEALDRIESFLLRCDAVKFAKYIPSGAENESASEDALRILQEAREAANSRYPAANSG